MQARGDVMLMIGQHGRSGMFMIHEANFYHHLEINNQSIKPTVEQLEYICTYILHHSFY